MIVSLGCSHSIGPYTKDDRPVNRGQNASDIVVSSQKFSDWPSIISNKLPEKIYRHFAVPGHGALTYYKLIKRMEEQGLLNKIEKLIIQWTHEIRLTSNENPTQYDNVWNSLIEESFDSNREFVFSIQYGKVFNYHAPFSLIEHYMQGTLTERKPSKSNVLDVSVLLENLMCLHSFTQQPKIIFDLIRSDIIRMCENYNIQFYEFAWDSVSSTNNNITRERKLERIHTIGEDNFDIVSKRLLQNGVDYDSMLNNGGHVKEGSQHIVNNMIIEFMEKQGLFNV